MIRETHPNREDWLNARMNGIGASEAAIVMGLSPWATTDTLFDIKTGRKKAVDISENPSVQVGVKSEPLIRELVMVDLPDWTCEYHAFDILRHDSYPFITATLDGELTDPNGVKHVLEIKTGSFKTKKDLEAWNEIPTHYLCQVCQQLAVTGWESAILAARLKREAYRASDDGLPEIAWRYFRIRAEDYQESIQAVLQADIEFWNSVQRGVRPDLRLSL